MTWTSCPTAWREDLHFLADGAVILAVGVGLVALFLQWRDQHGQREAVDAHIQGLASQAQTLLKHWRAGLSVPELARRIGAQGALPGDVPVPLFTAMAAEAPKASRSMRGGVSEAARLFWRIVSVSTSGVGLAGTVVSQLEEQFKGLDELLARLTAA